MDINFDIKGARQAGASDKDISDYFKSKYSVDFDVEGARKAGASDDDILGYINTTYSQKKSQNVTTNGANVVTSKGGEPQSVPSTVSGTRDKFIIEPTEKNIQELAEKRISDLQGQSSMADARKYAIDEINKTNSRITGKLTLGDESRQMGIAKSDMGMPSREEQLVKADVVTSKGGKPQLEPSTVSGTRDKVPTTYQWSGGDVGMQQKVITPTNADSKSAVNVVTKEMTAGGRLAEEKEGYELSNKKSLAEQEASKSFSIATENYTYDQVKNLVQLQSLLNKTIEDNKDPKLAKQTQDVEVIKKQIENLRNQQVTPKYTLNAEGQTVSYIKPKYKNVGEMYDETIMFQNKHQKLIGEIENYETKLNPIIEKARKNAQYTPNKKDEYGNTYYDLNPMEAFLNGADNSLETTAIGLANMFGFDDEAKSAAQMKWYKDNVISPKKADGLVSQGFEMLGAVAPLVAGGAVASGSVLGSVVMNSLLFGALDYGGTWYNSYASKKAEGMSDEEASKEANSNARFAGVKGMILGGTMPLQSMAGNKVGVSLFVTKAEQNSFRQFMYGQIGMLPAFGTSTALQNWYEGKPVTDNVGRAMIDAFIIGGMTHAIASLPKLPAETARLFEHTIAKNYNKVSTVIDAAVQDGTINPTVGENIVAKAKAYDKIKGAGLNEDVEVQVTELQVQIDKLEASKEGASPAVIAEIDRQINELSTKLKVEAGFPLTFDERKELNLLQTARDSNKEYDKAKLAELEQRQKNNQDGKTKIVTDQPIRVKYKDGRTGLVFVNAEGDVEFVPDGNSAGLVIDKQAGASFRSLANLGFEQVVGETIAEPNSQLLSGDISLGTSVLYKGGKYQIASSKNAPDGVKLDTDGKVRVVYLKGEDGKVIAVGADSADGKRIIDDANRVIGKGDVKPTETAPVTKTEEVKVEEDEYKAKQELAKKAEEAKKVAETKQEGETAPEIKTEKEITLFKGQMGKLNADGTKRTAHPNAEGFFASESEDTAKRYSGEDAPQKITLPKGVTIEEVQVADRNKPMSEIRREEENLINKSKAQVVVLKTIDAKGEEVQYIVKDKTLLEGKATPSDIKSTTEPTQEVKAGSVVGGEVDNVTVSTKDKNFNKEEFVRDIDKLEKEKKNGSKNIGLYSFKDKFVKVVKSKRKLSKEDLNRLRDRVSDIDNVYPALEIIDLPNGSQAIVMDKASGKIGNELTQKEIDNIPQEHWDKFEQTIRELSKRGVQTDLTKRSNVLYDKDKGFQFIDLEGASIEGDSTNKFFKKDGKEYYYNFEKYTFFPKEYKSAKEIFTDIKQEAVEQSLKETPKTEPKVEQASEQVQKFKDVLDQRTDKKTDKALKAFGEQAEKAKELIDNYDTNLKKLEEKGVEVKGTKEEILADMLDGKYDEALKSDTSIPSSKTEIERRPIKMLDGEDGIELIVKNEDGTETSMGKFYADDTKEMDKIERGLKLADQQKSKANENKTEIQKANEEVWKAIQDLLDAGDITNLGFAAKNVGEKSSEALDRLHKALVNSAKAYLKAGGTSLKQFAKNIGLSAKNAKQAWDEAMGLTTFNKDNLDYDLADIAKVAIRRGIKVREKLQEYKAKQKDIAQAIKAFMDDTEIKGALTPSQVKALVKRAASITTDAQFDKFIDYADKIIKDANLAQDLEDLRSNQKGAGKKRHNEKTADVRKFLDAEIFDEDGNLLLDEATFSEYSDAVAALNQKIPDHSLMEATDASGKTLSERVADQSQSASNPYMNINTVKDLMKAWTAIDNNIVDVDSYKSFTRNISKIKARLKDLVQAGTIKQDDYDTAISQIYKHENGKRVYEAKYGDQIGQLKSAQIADAQAKARLVDDSGFNKMQKELWQEFKHNMSVNFEKFKKLEVSDLDKLNTVLDRMGNGFMPEYEFRQVMNKIETQGQGVKIAKQVAKISDKFKNNLDKLRDLFETNDPARYEGELGIAGDKSLWNGVLSRTQRALKKYTETTHDMYEKWYDSLPSFYKITGKKPVLIDKIDAKDGKVGKTVVSQREYDMVKVGAVRHMINHAAEMMAKGKDPIDVFGEQLADIKERQNYATEGELSILTDVYNKLKSNPDLLDINGELDYNKIWKSVEANDGKVLDVNQAKIESSFDGLDLETGDMITSSNAIQGVNATKNPKHIRRYYVGTRVGEGEINESGQIGIRAGSSYARADKDMPSGAMLLNAEKIIQRQIKEAAKDYHLNQELDKLDYVFEEAKLAANREDINVLNEFQQDQRRIMQYHLSSGDIPPIFNKIQGGLYVKMLTTPVRLSAEAVSNTTQMLLRGKSLKGILTSVPSQTINPFFKEMTDIMKATESTSLDHAEFRSMKNIETKDGQIQREGLLKRGVDVINGVTNAMAVGGIWMPNFNRKFAELTGENYNNSMLKNPKYVDAMREASSYADRETETVIGSTLKGGSRRVIVLTPFGGKLKADSTLGSLAKFLSNYPYRDTKELVRGINQMVTGVNEGRIDGAARSMGVVTNMMLYTGIYAISKAVWEQTFGDDDEKKEAKETIDRLSTKEGFLDFTKQEALSNAVNLAGTKYSQAGKMMTRLSVIALYNSNLLDETQKKDLANFAEAQLYMYFNKKSFRKSDVKSEFYNVIPHLKEASDIFYREVEGEEGVTALLKEAREKGVEGLTKDKQAKLSLLKNFIHTTNILLYSQGTQLPFSKDFVKSLDVQIKELNK